MKRHINKLQQQQQEQHEAQTEAREHTAQEQSVREFATAEELLRFDADQTEVPPAVAERLQKSLDREPKRDRTWWQRLLE